MKIFILVFTLIGNLTFADVSSAVKTFKIPYYQQIFEINPQSLKSSSGQYFYQNLFRNFLWYDNEKGLIPDLAEKCSWKSSLVYQCTLRKNLKWSDGSPLKIESFVDTYKNLLSSAQSNSNRKDLLFAIKGAKEFAEGSLSWEKVGIKTKGANQIEFTLKEEDPDFEFVLIQTITAPTKNIKKITDFKDMIFSGPYKIKDFKKSEQKITFTKNENYPLSKSNIDIEWIYLTEDALQIPLYTNKEIDFVKRLPTSQISEWKDKSDYYAQEVLRFDYYGFNIQKITKEQREILFTRIPFDEIKKIFFSKGRPGCFQFGKDFIEKEELCYDYKKPNAEDLVKVSGIKGDFLLSQAGGEDHQRASEWIQNQWKNLFKFQINVRILENKIFLQHLKNDVPLFYRKGIPLESASCLAALKIFNPESQENLNQINDSELNQIIAKMKKTKKDSKALCQKALERIKDQVYLIPTGKFDIAYLIRPDFKDIHFNKLNYLDLSQLSLK